MGSADARLVSSSWQWWLENKNWDWEVIDYCNLFIDIIDMFTFMFRPSVTWLTCFLHDTEQRLSFQFLKQCLIYASFFNQPHQCRFLCGRLSHCIWRLSWKGQSSTADGSYSVWSHPVCSWGVYHFRTPSCKFESIYFLPINNIRAGIYHFWWPHSCIGERCWWFYGHPHFWSILWFDHILDLISTIAISNQTFTRIRIPLRCVCNDWWVWKNILLSFPLLY